MNIEEAARQLEALGNPTRLRLYRVLVRAGHGGLPVNQVQERLGIPASTLSHHLQRLVQNGLVSQERQATTLICRAVYPAERALSETRWVRCHLYDEALEAKRRDDTVA